MQRNKVYVGNNLDILKTFPDNSIDSIVTDPPYGLGKEPNATEVLQSWITTGYHEVSGKGFMGKEWDAFVPQPIFWKECIRVLKPGGYLLSFAGTRTYDWIVMGLRLSGFEIRDMIAWLYGSGFPKSHDVSKAIDKSMGAKREVVGSYKGVTQNKESVGGGFNASKGADEHGRKTVKITTPSTEEAKQWQGWGTALKPALEPIVMARKPLEDTVARNVLKYGTGAINIDGCRVGDEHFKIEDGEYDNGNNVAFGNVERTPKEYNGRFPANVIHDGSDEVVELFPNTTSTQRNPSNNKPTEYTNTYTPKEAQYSELNTYADSGSASRFFYTAKASQFERNYGLYGFESQETRGGGGRAEQGYDDENEEEQRLKKSAQAFGAVKAKKKNIHPTVKPLDLMQYLVRLVTPKGGVCLDPFLGSGTTAIACKAEKIDYIGCELMPEYAKIAEARIKAEVVKYDIFDFMF